MYVLKKSLYIWYALNLSECSSGVEHDLAKVGVEGSNPFTRSKYRCPGGGIGRHAGLKILWAVMSVRVQVPPWVLKLKYLF